MKKTTATAIAFLLCASGIRAMEQGEKPFDRGHYVQRLVPGLTPPPKTPRITIPLDLHIAENSKPTDSFTVRLCCGLWLYSQLETSNGKITKQLHPFFWGPKQHIGTPPGTICPPSKEDCKPKLSYIAQVVGSNGVEALHLCNITAEDSEKGKTLRDQLILKRGQFTELESRALGARALLCVLNDPLQAMPVNVPSLSGRSLEVDLTPVMQASGDTKQGHARVISQENENVSTFVQEAKRLRRFEKESERIIKARCDDALKRLRQEIYGSNCESDDDSDDEPAAKRGHYTDDTDDSDDDSSDGYLDV